MPEAGWQLSWFHFICLLYIFFLLPSASHVFLLKYTLHSRLTYFLNRFSFFLCLSSSCLNNGTCIDGINTFSCRCRRGFTGAFCEYEQNECDSQPCKNGGTCTDGLGTYRCTCRVEYNGQNCQVMCPLVKYTDCLGG